MADVSMSFATLKRHAAEHLATRRMRPKYRFRAVVRQVINNLDWLTDEDGVATGAKAKMNLIMLRSKSKAEKSNLTIQDKAIMMKPFENRTEEDKNKLFRALSSLSSFRRCRYTEDVQRQLADNTYFSTFSPHRVIIRQGHDPLALYFLLEGQVTISVTLTDPVTGKLTTKDVGTMVAGDMFGEVGLLHNTKRSATVTTTTTCSLLWIWKHEFDSIMKAQLASKWEEATRIMKSLSYFDKWDDKTLQDTCILAKILNFQPNEIIFGDSIGNAAYVYFITSGECGLIEALQLFVKPSAGNTTKYPKNTYRLYDGKTPRTLSETQETYFVQVSLMRAGTCFNLGENLGTRTIIANTDVQCMTIPRYWIFQNNYSNIWNRVVAYLDATIPSTKDVFRNFQEERRWMCYKQNLVKEIVHKHTRVNNTTIHDVPYSLRMNAVYPPHRPGVVHKSARRIRVSIMGKEEKEETAKDIIKVTEFQ